MPAREVEDLAKIMLGETSGLTAQGATATAAQMRLWAVVGNIAQFARGGGVLGQMRRAGEFVPTAEAANYPRIQELAEQIYGNRYVGQPTLPRRAALWSLSPDKYLSYSPRKPPVWINGPGVSQTAEFQDANGVVYRLYELADAPPPGECGYASAYTATGVLPPAWSVPPAKRNWAWVIGVAAALVFFYGAFSAVLCGHGDGSARALFRETKQQGKLIDKLADNCLAEQKTFARRKVAICDFLAADKDGDYQKPQAVAGAAPAYGAKLDETLATVRNCLNLPPAVGLPVPAGKKADDADVLVDHATACELVARSAAQTGVIDPVNSFIDGWVASLLGRRTLLHTRSLNVQMFLLGFGIAGLVLALGLGTKARLLGVWIDERNRVSLARAQVTLWTVVALAGYGTAALYNSGLGGATAFPMIPAAIAAALGISFAAPAISALILKTKDFGAAGSPSDLIKRVGQRAPDDNDFRNRGGLVDVDDQSPLEIRDKPSDASIADVFLGELASQANSADISRLQNVTFTITLVMGYAAMLVNQLGAIPVETILSGVPALPDPGGPFTAVLLASHAAYLGTKAYKGAEAPK
jgi:hypothetical protein